MQPQPQSDLLPLSPEPSPAQQCCLSWLILFAVRPTARIAHTARRNPPALLCFPTHPAASPSPARQRRCPSHGSLSTRTPSACGPALPTPRVPGQPPNFAVCVCRQPAPGRPLTSAPQPRLLALGKSPSGVGAMAEAHHHDTSALPPPPSVPLSGVAGHHHQPPPPPLATVGVPVGAGIGLRAAPNVMVAPPRIEAQPWVRAVFGAEPGLALKPWLAPQTPTQIRVFGGGGQGSGRGIRARKCRAGPGRAAGAPALLLLPPCAYADQVRAPGARPGGSCSRLCMQPRAATPACTPLRMLHIPRATFWQPPPPTHTRTPGPCLPAWSACMRGGGEGAVGATNTWQGGLASLSPLSPPPPLSSSLLQTSSRSMPPPPTPPPGQPRSGSGPLALAGHPHDGRGARRPLPPRVRSGPFRSRGKGRAGQEGAGRRAALCPALPCWALLHAGSAAPAL